METRHLERDDFVLARLSPFLLIFSPMGAVWE